MRFFKCLLMLALCSIASAQQFGLTYHQVQVVDETGEKITDISSVELYLPDTTTNATIYKDPAKTDTITIPMTTGSTNTTLSNGFFSWWGPDGWDFSITDGTNIATNAGHRTRTGSDGRIVFPSYLTSISSTTYADNETITLGTSSDWVINAGTSADLLTFTPATNGAVFRVGTSNGATCADLQWYTASGVGLLIDEGADTLGITGLTTSINASSNYATNINTGTSTGAVTVGSSTAGAIALDSTSTLTANSDAAMSLTTTDASADITVDATAGSVIIDGGEAVADAVVIQATGAAGGVDIISLADIDITTTGAAGEDISITNTGGSIILQATEAAADAIVLNASTAVGGIDITSNADIDITTTGAAGEDISIINTGGSVIVQATESGTDSIVIEATTGGVQILASGAAATEDILLTATGSSIILSATEAAADAIVLSAATAAGGIDITSNADIDITTTGAAGEDITITNTGGSIAISATEDAADALTLTVNGGTSEKIVVTNTQGTDAAAIDLTATAGGITLTAGGGLTLAVTGTVTAGGSAITNKKATVEVFDANDTLTAAESGKVCIAIGLAGVAASNQVLTLPTAAAGLEFYFYDANATAADDLWITAGAGDTINGGTAAKSYICTGDAVKQGLHIVAQDATAWIILSEVGTWANNND